MKKKFCLTVLLIAAMCLSAAGAAFAEIVEYPDAALQIFVNPLEGGAATGVLAPKGTGGEGTEDDPFKKTGSLSGNVVNLNSDSEESVYFVLGGGNYVDQAAVNNNTVNVRDGSKIRAIFGGGGQGNATGNVVNVSGGNHSEAMITGGGSLSGNAVSNTVNISGGLISEVEIAGGGSDSNSGNSTGNTINISGGEMSFVFIEGGGSNGNSTRNTVNITGGKISGSEWWISGGGSGYDSADNTVNITGGELIISSSTPGTGIAGGGSDRNTTRNTVNIGGDAVISSANIHGGFSFSGSTTYNTINISGNPTFLDEAKEISPPALFGGYGDWITGNTLNLYTSEFRGVSVSDATVLLPAAKLSNFANLNFHLSPRTTNGVNVLGVGENVNLSGVTVKVGIDGSLPNLAVGDSINLLVSSGEIINYTPVANVQVGKYVFEIGMKESALAATVHSIATTEKYEGGGRLPAGDTKITFGTGFEIASNGAVTFYGSGGRGEVTLDEDGSVFDLPSGVIFNKTKGTLTLPAGGTAGAITINGTEIKNLPAGTVIAHTKAGSVSSGAQSGGATTTITTGASGASITYPAGSSKTNASNLPGNSRIRIFSDGSVEHRSRGDRDGGCSSGFGFAGLLFAFTAFAVNRGRKAK